MIENKVAQTESIANRPNFIPDIFSFLPDAQSQKNLRRFERSMEAQRALHMTDGGATRVIGNRVLIIDDVVTTGATVGRARELALRNGASHVYVLSLAKTVSILSQERTCSACGKAMVIKKGPYGSFWGCAGFKRGDADSCNHKEPLMKKDCPECGRPMRVFEQRSTGQKFWSCTGYNQTPACKTSMDVLPSEMPN